MWKDKIVEEVRKNREELFAEYDYDSKKFLRAIMEDQAKNKDRVVSFVNGKERKQIGG